MKTKIGNMLVYFYTLIKGEREVQISWNFKKDNPDCDDIYFEISLYWVNIIFAWEEKKCCCKKSKNSTKQKI
jgi:hypothetical protein